MWLVPVEGDQASKLTLAFGKGHCVEVALFSLMANKSVKRRSTFLFSTGLHFVSEPVIAFVRRLAGPAASATGVLGLAVSGTVWHFYGRLPGLSGTVVSLIVLAVGLVLLRPFPVPAQINQPSSEQPAATPAEASDSLAIETTETLTTAEAIARELAEDENRRPEAVLVTYAPQHLLPGTTIPVRKRRPGVSFKPFREMTDELFKS